MTNEQLEKQRAACRRYYHANKERAKERRIKWAKENPEKIAAYSKSEARKEYAKIWWQNNRQKASGYRKSQRKKDPEQTKINDKLRHEKYKDKARVQWREYARKNRPKFTAKLKKWSKENPERLMDHRMKYRWKKQLNGTRLSHGLTKRLYAQQNGLCAHCKADLSVTKYHKDHIIPVSKGGPHQDDNIQLLCPPCNLSKGNRIRPYPIAEIENSPIGS